VTQQIDAAILGLGFPAVDTIILGSDTMPGQWILLPGGKEFGFQEQQATGISGATIRPIGDPLVHAHFLVRFWNAQDWARFQPLRTRYLSKAAVTVAGER
jgi:hypothetical protein